MSDGQSARESCLAPAPQPQPQQQQQQQPAAGAPLHPRRAELEEQRRQGIARRGLRSDTIRGLRGARVYDLQESDPEPDQSPGRPYHRVQRPPPLSDAQLAARVGLVAGERCPRSPPPRPRAAGEPPDRPVQSALCWSHTGRWHPLRIDTIRRVNAELREFAGAYEALNEALLKQALPVDAEGPARRRLRQMQRSAELRLAVLVDFYAAHKKDPRAEGIKQGVRALRAIGPVQPVIDDPAAAGPQVVGGPATEAATRGVSFSPGSRRGAGSPSPRAQPRSPMSAASQRAESEPGLIRIGDRNFNMLSPEARQRVLDTEEEKCEQRLAAIGEQRAERSAKISELTAETLRLERACLEMSEGRDRMRGMVEEQVYTTELLTRIGGLLHLEMRRTTFRTVAHLFTFWGVSFLLLLYCFVGGGQEAVAAVAAVGADLGAGPLLVLFKSLLVLSAAGLLREWASRAVDDVQHGAVRSMLQAAGMRRDDTDKQAERDAAEWRDRAVCHHGPGPSCVAWCNRVVPELPDGACSPASRTGAAPAAEDGHGRRGRHPQQGQGDGSAMSARSSTQLISRMQSSAPPVSPGCTVDLAQNSSKVLPRHQS
eukprot:TRINITY_DN30468_c0_g1_i1.p1 TRINITY_DN30468_c0_g1~~TRINITY_DN30468_c0_g1_i1.p1  ORF type:complete len:627 (+),score=161.93 TRINITY_DN30468_c0_g1_i1:90-1883(+)